MEPMSEKGNDEIEVSSNGEVIQEDPKEVVKTDEHYHLAVRQQNPGALTPLRAVATPEEARKTEDEYRALILAVMTREDVDHREYKKKNGEVVHVLAEKTSWWVKVRRHYGISTRIVKSWTDYRADGSIVARAIAEAFAPNGRTEEGSGACSSNEERFQTWDSAKRQMVPMEPGDERMMHDMEATAETRAKKRATESLCGMGKITYSEYEKLPSRDGKQTGPAGSVVPDVIMADKEPTTKTLMAMAKDLGVDLVGQAQSAVPETIPYIKKKEKLPWALRVQVRDHLVRLADFRRKKAQEAASDPDPSDEPPEQVSPSQPQASDEPRPLELTHVIVKSAYLAKGRAEREWPAFCQVHVRKTMDFTHEDLVTLLRAVGALKKVTPTNVVPLSQEAKDIIDELTEPPDDDDAV